MSKRICSIAVLLSVAFVAPRARAQTAPPIRPIGRLERTSPDSLASVATALQMPGGRVLVHDRVARRVLLFDSTLTHATVIADTTSATANAYGGRPGALIRFHADSAVFIDQTSLSMLVIGPTGAVARVMAVPRAPDVQAMMGNAGFDARGWFVYSNSLNLGQGVLMLGVGDHVVLKDGNESQNYRLRAESAALVRVDLATRVLDTAAAIAIARLKRVLKTDASGGLTAIETTPDPLPLLDEWTTLPDGSIAILRARDYHIDWVGVDAKLVSTPKMPFDWQRVDDARKQTLIDSTVASWQATFDRIMNPSQGRAQTGGAAGSGGGGRGGGGGGSGGSPGSLAPMIAMRALLNDVPDYMPPTSGRLGSLSGDAEGNVWIRTTTLVQGQPVYDIVNRRGVVIDRVQLPSFRTIAGFGPGVIYMAVKGNDGVVHLERARIK